MAGHPKPGERFWWQHQPFPFIRQDPNRGERFWHEGLPFYEYVFGGGQAGSLTWDLLLEVAWQGACEGFPFPETSEERRPPEAEGQEEAAGGEEIARELLGERPAPAPSPLIERLLQESELLEQHTQALLDIIRDLTEDLVFAIPRERVDLRGALIALEMAPEQISYRDYEDLLKLQVETATRITDPAYLNEGVLQANAQIELLTQFFETQLQSHISDSAAWATQAKPLLKTQATGRLIRNYLNDYNKFPVNNTLLKAMGGKASLADILRDCIPCLERALNFPNPLEAFLKMLLDELQRRWAYIQSLWSALNGRQLNICDLLRYLNSLCLPDLFALLAVLSYYWIQLMGLFNLNVSQLLWSLIQPLLSGFFCSLERLFGQFIRLLLAPIECIITSLDREFAKLYNLGQATTKDFWTKGPQSAKPYDHRFARWAHEQVINPILHGVGPYGMGLLELKRALMNARDFINAQVKRLRDAVREILGVDADALDNSRGLLFMLRWLAMVIGLVKAVIKFKEQGFQCGPEGLNRAQYNTLASYLGRYYTRPVVVTDKPPPLPPTLRPTPQTTLPEVEPSSPQEMAEEIFRHLAELMANLQEEASQFDPTIVPTLVVDNYQIPDCVAIQTQLEAARVQTWIAELEGRD